MFIIIAVAVIIVVLVLIGIGIYNGLVGSRNQVKNAWAQIDVQLKRRHDLIPNLVETVKGYAAHEKSTLDEVVRARNAAVAAQGPNAQGAAEGALGAALSRLIALSEAYPDLKANQNFQQLQGELADIENKIAAARRFLNNTVAEYNAAIEGVPGVLIASRFGFEPLGYFGVDEAERKAIEAPPAVKF